MTDIKTFYFNDLRECTYVIWDETGECVIIDPGCHTTGEQERLTKFIEDNRLKPRKVLNTHGHFDHILGNRFVSLKWDIPTYIHSDDKPFLHGAKEHSKLFGYTIETPPTDTKDLIDGQLIKFGNSTLRVVHTPGHSKGGVCFVSDSNKFIVTGDSLFAGSIGRTDLPGGDYDELMDSLLKRILPIGENYTVYPGHGPATTIANEIATNPFLRYE